MKAKYIMTNNGIIVFPQSFSHSDFSHFKPTSAGFISFGTDGKYKPRCECSGESFTLKMKSDEKDTRRAMKQLITEYCEE